MPRPSRTDLQGPSDEDPQLVLDHDKFRMYIPYVPFSTLLNGVNLTHILPHYPHIV